MTFATRSIVESDKHYWHRYTDIYEQTFRRLGAVRHVVEFGVFHGASIRWLAECFPSAQITGLDIVPIQLDWPRSERIKYLQVDQGSRAAVKEALVTLTGVDLIVEDGSHIPQHQANCLAEGMSQVRPGGAYILEDICTSHPLQEAFAHHSVIGGRRRPNALNVLMALQHLKDTKQELDATRQAALSDPHFLSSDDVCDLFNSIERIEIYKRTQLPIRCYACGGADFDYVEWQCRCGVGLYDPANSMTAIVWRKPE